jgi:hypothetical protein
MAKASWAPSPANACSSRPVLRATVAFLYVPGPAYGKDEAQLSSRCVDLLWRPVGWSGMFRFVAASQALATRLREFAMTHGYEDILAIWGAVIARPARREPNAGNVSQQPHAELLHRIAQACGVGFQLRFVGRPRRNTPVVEYKAA